MRDHEKEKKRTERKRLAEMGRRVNVAAGLAMSGLCMGVFVSTNWKPNVSSIALRSEGPPLPLIQLPAINFKPRPWVHVSATAKEVDKGAQMTMKNAPKFGTTAAIDQKPADGIESDALPHIFFVDKTKKGATAIWKTGAEAGKDNFVDDEDENSPKFGSTVSVSPKDARVGAYVRYVSGAPPPGVAQSDDAKSAEDAAKQAAAKEAARDPNRDEGARIACNLTPEQMTLDPPPCKVFPSKKTNEKEQEENLYE